MTISKTQLQIIRELQANPGASFLFTGHWELQLSRGVFSVYRSHPIWSSFKALIRMGLVKREDVGEDGSRYYLTEEGVNFTR